MAITDTSERSATDGGAAKSAKRGRGVLRDPQLNHGTAFTAKERATLGLEGLLPAGVLSLEEQAKRSYDQYNAEPTNLAKNQFLAALRDRKRGPLLQVVGGSPEGDAAGYLRPGGSAGSCSMWSGGSNFHPGASART